MDQDDSGSEQEPEFDGERAQEFFNNWIISLQLDQHQMFAVILIESFKNWPGMKGKGATQEAGSIVDFNEKTVRKHCNDLFNNKGYLLESRQGKYV